ncbi:MAG: cupin domain-containing protein [Woeseiaceae bacterium]|nr:cupin domain-containing protein [Woeseiaceae bacterium]
MLTLPGDLDPAAFLRDHWQKKPLFIPQGTPTIRPSVSRNELAWLATLDDVESRLVFTDRDQRACRYRVENGPFEAACLQALARRDWTLLVHDVEKHLPALRKLFGLVPFIPDWRIDDLMISFAAPGGSVGPHRDQYDVFLCQGIGVREWRIASSDIESDPAASSELALLQEFPGEKRYRMRQGDILYLPPGVAHWGIAQRACLTYSIGMRAPDAYSDPDLALTEVRPGYISPAANQRAAGQRTPLGCQVTTLKEWLRPEVPAEGDLEALLTQGSRLRGLCLHGMARIAYDDERLYLNGTARPLAERDKAAVEELCRRRHLNSALLAALGRPCLRWLLQQGAFALP